MRTQSRDTSVDVERILIRGHQRFSPSTRFGRVRSMTYTLAEANRQNAPALGDSYERAVSFVYGLYGAPAAAALRDFAPLPADMAFDLLATIERIARVFADRQIPFALTGSIACCMYGFPRTCRDIDLLIGQHDFARIGLVSSLFAVIDDDPARVPGFPMLASWLDPQTLIKVDLLAAPVRFVSDRLLIRAPLLALVEQELTLPVLSAEDVILTRLQWYVATGRRADDQWNDLMGIVKVQAPTLDGVYLRSQARRLHLSKILTQLFADTDFEGIANVTAHEYPECPPDGDSGH